MAAGLLGIIAPILLARFMSVEDFAAYVAVQAFASLAALFGSLGMDRVAYRFIPALAEAGKRGAIVTVMASAQVMRLGAVAVSTVLMLVFAEPLRQSDAVQLQNLWPWLLALGLVSNVVEMLMAGAQSLFKAAAVIYVSFAVSVLRAIAIAAVAWSWGSISFDVGMSLVLCSELAMAVALFAVMAESLMTMKRVDTPSPPARPTARQMLQVGVSNYAGYVLCQAWGGAMLRLLISVSASATTTAAFGLFISLADRARLYLPVAFMERQLEPIWSADYYKRRQFKRFQASAGAMLKLQFYVLATATVLLAWEGHWLVSTFVKKEFASSYGLIVLILVRLMFNTYGSTLWMAANASGQPELIWRGNLLAFLILFAPIVYSGTHLHPAITLIIGTLPTAVWLSYLMYHGHWQLCASVVRLPSAAQVGWLIAACAMGLLFETPSNHLPVLVMAIGVYWLGVLAQARLFNAPLLEPNERFAFRRYMGMKRRS